jgi:8-oxo-dGTP pyrophosphatase MutT (NUDIX family)
MTEPKKARPAATVILLRRAEPRGFELFLTRRPDDMPFLGGVYCFPGGTVRNEDHSPSMLRRCHGLLPNDARKIAGAHFAPAEALGLWVAAIRELFEEVGVLLAVNENGEGQKARHFDTTELGKRHAALLEKSLSFRSFLESEKLLCDLSRLAYFSYWRTPSESSVRFDTRFFLAMLPDDQSPMLTSPEVAHGLWLTPDRALELFANNELPMIFPTFASLRTLADFDTLESLFREYRFGSSRTGVLEYSR